MSTRPLMFAGALLFAVALDGACVTENVHPDVILPEDRSDSGIMLFVIRDDAISLDPVLAARYASSPSLYRTTVDGRFLAYDETTYAQAAAQLEWNLPVPVGSHVVALVDWQGNALVSSPAIETKPFGDPSLPSYLPYVVFFGSPTALRARVLIDDPAALPEGAVHLRVMNTFVNHEPLQVVQCANDLVASSQQVAGTCAPVGAPIAYGDVFETDAGADVVNKLGYYWAGPSAVAAAVQGINGEGPSPYITAGASSRFVTRLPVQVEGPASTCPSCLLFGY